MSKNQALEKSVVFTALQLLLGVALLALSTHLALESNTYLEVLNQSFQLGVGLSDGQFHII